MPEKPIRIMCPNLKCRRVLSVPTKARGKMVRCAGCQASVRIPKQAPAKSASKPASEEKSNA